MDHRLGLINTYSTLNIGDAAIYSALSTMASEAQVIARFQDAEPEYVPGVAMVNQLSRCDAYISVGGDIFNNAREQFVTKTFLHNLGQLLQSPRHTFVFGQSIPRSCHGLSFKALTTLFRQLAAVCVRDAESHQRLIQAGVSAILSYDTAFSLEVSDAAKQEVKILLQVDGIDPNNTVLLSLRAFDSMYAHDNQKFQRTLVQLCEKLCQRGHQPVLLIQAKAYGADHDLAVAEQIIQHVPAVKVFNPFIQNSSLSNWERVMAALAVCPIAIAIRYHTAVLRLASGRMPFNLYYSNKGRDLTQRLGIPGCSLDALDVDQAIAQIEQTAELTFDHEAIRQQVKQDFQQCYRKVIAA